MAKAKGTKQIAANRKAYHDYFVDDNNNVFENADPVIMAIAGMEKLDSSDSSMYIY